MVCLVPVADGFTRAGTTGAGVGVEAVGGGAAWCDEEGIGLGGGGGTTTFAAGGAEPEPPAPGAPAACGGR